MSMLLMRFRLGNRHAVVIASSYEEAAELLNDADTVGDNWRESKGEIISSVYPQLKPHVLAME